MRPNKSLQPTPLRGAAELHRCRGRFAPATTGRRISIRMVAWREAPHNHADQADSGRQSLRLSRPSRLIRRPVGRQNATGMEISNE